MTLDIQNALRLGQFVNAAYNPVSTNPAKYSLPFNYQLVQVLYANDLATDVNAVKLNVPLGFIAQSPPPAANDFVVAIRGTESIWEWVQDARFLMVDCPFATGAGKTYAAGKFAAERRALFHEGLDPAEALRDPFGVIDAVHANAHRGGPDAQPAK